MHQSEPSDEYSECGFDYERLDCAACIRALASAEVGCVTSLEVTYIWRLGVATFLLVCKQDFSNEIEFCPVIANL